MLRHRDILLARAIAVSPWLGAPGCALPCFGFIGFLFFLCVGLVVGLSDAGLSDVELSDVVCRMSDVRFSDVGLSVVGLLRKWVSAALGEVLDQPGHKSLTQVPKVRACAIEKYIRGELNTSMVLDALREISMGASVVRCLKQNMASRSERK